ncbi:MAG: T9SS type A sorting domain-containing protein [Bacteroidota bacterium]
MNRNLLNFIMVAVTLLAASWFISESGRRTMPVPDGTIIIDKDGAGEDDHQEARRQWIESMHRCAPGTNWRAMDFETSMQKLRMNGPKKDRSGTVSIAGGLITGYWHETGSDNLAGRTHLVEFDPATDSVYCASSGGNVWKGHISGNGWRSLHDNLQIDDIKMLRKIDNGTGKRLLLASGAWGAHNFYYSDNDGTSWTYSSGLNSIANWGSVVRAVVANDQEKSIYLLAYEWNYTDWNLITTLYFSDNKGVSFSKIGGWDEPVYGSENKFDIWTDYYGSGTVYLLINDDIYYLDAANNPVFISNINYTTQGDVMLTGCEMGGATWLYIAVYGNDHVDFYQSSNGGTSWSTKGFIDANPFMKTSFACSVKNPQNLFYGGMECYRSHNGAQNWVKINNWGDYYGDMLNRLHADIPSINSFLTQSGSEILFVNTDGGTYVSYDSLLHVQNISLSDLNVSQYYSVYTHRTNTNYIFLGSQDQGYQLSSNVDTSMTVSFTQILSGDYGHIVSGNGGQGVWMDYPGFVAYYPAAVTNPYYSEWWDFTCTGQHWIPPLMAHPSNPHKAFLGGGSTGSGAHIFELTYTGSSITDIEHNYDFSGPSGTAAISAMAFSPVNSNYRYVMNSEGNFYYSTDGGTNWTMTSGFDGPDGNYLYGATIVPSPVTLGKVYIAGSGYSNPAAYVSDNNGQSFSSLNLGLPNTMVYEMAATPNGEYLFAATEVGPYIYVASTNHWYALDGGYAPDQTYWTVDYVPSIQTARFGTYGRGVWDFRVLTTTGNPALTGIVQNIAVWPNPSDGVIYFDNPDGGRCAISIWSADGTPVLNTTLSGNRLDVSSLPQGTYILKINNGTITVTKKIIKL